MRAAIVLVVCAAIFPWLPRLLAVSDPLPARADAIFVFPGQVPERARCAAELYEQGLAPRVVFTGGKIAPELVAVDRPMSDAAVNATIAARAGVPLGAEVVLPEGTSTWEDAGVLRRWVEASGARTVVAVTSPTHSRRARCTVRLALRASGARVFLHSCGEPDSPGSLWWMNERSLVTVTNEFLKLPLYLFRYFLPTALGLRPPP